MKHASYGKDLSLVCPVQLMNYILHHKKTPLREVLKDVKTAILCLTSGLAGRLKKNLPASYVFKQSVRISGMVIDRYQKQILNHKGNKKSGSLLNPPTVVVSGLGTGAPAAVIGMEKLKALGIKEFITLGMAGALSPDLKTGDQVFIQKAFRDEGCSYHYQKKEEKLKKKPFPSVTVLKTLPLYQSLRTHIKLKCVTSWTTDAPFRETRQKVSEFKKQGVQCVEMEASALMCAARYYGLSVCCLSVISDHIRDEKWTLDFFNPRVKINMLELCRQILLLP